MVNLGHESGLVLCNVPASRVWEEGVGFSGCQIETKKVVFNTIQKSLRSKSLAKKKRLLNGRRLCKELQLRKIVVALPQNFPPQKRSPFA